MIGYLVFTSLITLCLGVGMFIFVRVMIEQGRMTEYDGKGYYMVLMFLVTFIGGAAAFFSGQSEAIIEGSEQLSRVSLGILSNVACAIVVLAVGLLKLKKTPQFSS